MLTDVPEIDQKDFKTMVRLAIRTGDNVLVLGPSGGGKTLMAEQACEEENCKLVYVNLSVLERTDFQGFPVVSSDGKRVNYATPSFLEFQDESTHEERTSLLKFKETVSDSNLKSAIDGRIAELDERDKSQALVNASPYFSSLPVGSDAKGKKLAKIIEDLVSKAGEEIGKDVPIVFLFDEADKAMVETCQTLLEFLQFKSINGRRLNVKACVLTGNLPDEHAHVNNISHAISKRCRTYKLSLDPKLWQQWALQNGVHEHIVQFIASEPTLMYQPAKDGDPTAYAMPSPRTWTMAAGTLKNLETDKFFLGMSEEVQADVRLKIVAGSVGDTAAAKFNSWYKFYRRFDPFVNKLIETGEFPNTSNLGSSEVLIMAISACSKVYAELKPNNKKNIEKATKNVYKWLDTQSADIQMGAIRLSFGGDWTNCHKYDLPKIPEFVKVFKGIKSKLGQWESDLSSNNK